MKMVHVMLSGPRSCDGSRGTFKFFSNSETILAPLIYKGSLAKSSFDHKFMNGFFVTAKMKGL